MSERKISKSLRKDRESTVSAVDIKSLTSSESTFNLRPLKVREIGLMILLCVPFFFDLRTVVTLMSCYVQTSLQASSIYGILFGFYLSRKRLCMGLHFSLSRIETFI